MTTVYRLELTEQEFRMVVDSVVAAAAEERSVPWWMFWQKPRDTRHYWPLFQKIDEAALTPVGTEEQA